MVYPDTVQPVRPERRTSPGWTCRPAWWSATRCRELRQTDQFRDQAEGLHRQRRFPDRHHHRQAGPGRGGGGRRHPPRHRAGGGAGPAARTGRPRSWRSSPAPAGCWPTTAAATAPARTTPAGTTTRTGRPGASASTRPAPRSRSTTWPRRCAATSPSTPSTTRRPPRSSRPAGAPRARPHGPVRNAGTAACQPSCTLVQSTVASLNVPFFELTEKLGPPAVIEMAARPASTPCGPTSRSTRAPTCGASRAPRCRRRGSRPRSGSASTAITVIDHANGMATFAAGGKRAQAHFVRQVEKKGEVVYGEQLDQDRDRADRRPDRPRSTRRWSRCPSGRFSDDWDAAGKTGTWQAGESTTENAHVWMVGYTRALAAAVWVGTTDGEALITAGRPHQRLRLLPRRPDLAPVHARGRRGDGLRRGPAPVRQADRDPVGHPGAHARTHPGTDAGRHARADQGAGPADREPRAARPRPPR